MPWKTATRAGLTNLGNVPYWPAMRWWLWVMVVACGVTTARGQDSETSWRDHLTLSASLRVRGELADWFEPPSGVGTEGAERYAFFGSQLRLGARLVFPFLEFFVDVQDTRITGLPDDATFGPPQGALGPGATYFLYTHKTTQGEPFLKQGFVTLRRGGLAATIGRFEYREGLEVLPADRTLATVKRTRIAERLIGPFDFTHVTRSFDGARVVVDRPDWNVTALGVRPTHGGFEVSANRSIEDVGVAGVALTAKRLPVAVALPFDARLFYLYYEDRRRDVVKVDARPLPTREEDREAIEVHTMGAHALTAFDAGPGTVDLLAWAVGQTGAWGRLQQRSWAYALEAAYHLTRLPTAPWLRAGINRSSGDDDPLDGRHGTFFQLLPTPRAYALTPFFNMMNNQDLFASLTLQPFERLTLRTDYHYLRVTEGRDLWYSGGGASNDDIFGFSGAPADRRHHLAQLVDLSATLVVTKNVSVAGYYGHAFGGGVVGQSFAGRDLDYGFVEMTFKY